MSHIKKLASQTAIYGLSSILARMVSNLLTPFLTRVFDTSQYGINAEFFVYVSFLNIVFTYGMETAYFRYVHLAEDKNSVFDTAFVTLLTTSVLFGSAIIVFAQPIATWLEYQNYPEYIRWFGCILVFDTLSVIPFARLRIDNRPIRYAVIKTSGILVTVLLTIFLTGVCPYILNHNFSGTTKSFISYIYNPSVGVGYTFIATLAGSMLVFCVFLPGLIRHRYKPSREMLRQLIPYALPMLVIGTAGMINETLDRYLLKKMLNLPLHEKQAQIGIYSACYRISIIMSLFIQAYKMAAEPFFFSHSKTENPQRLYAQSMKYSIIVCSGIFLGVMVNIDIVKLLIGESFRVGIQVVPILLMANLFLGAYYNLAVWYKLTDKMIAGSIIALVGAAITLGLNFWWIPIYGYTGAAWATCICYGSMMLISYIAGQQYYPVPYPVGRILFYIILSVVLWQITRYLQQAWSHGLMGYLALGAISVTLFTATVYRLERMKK